MTQPPAHALAPGASRGWSPPPRGALDYPVFFDPGPAVARPMPRSIRPGAIASNCSNSSATLMGL